MSYQPTMSIDKHHYKLKVSGQANTEVGSLLVIDPCMLFTHDEWSAALDDEDDYGDSIVKALCKKLGLDDHTTEFLQEHSAVVGTGGDSTFLIAQPEDAPLPIVIGWPSANQADV